MTPAERRALAAAKRLARTFEGVTGVDFGRPYRSGVREGSGAIRFHVAQKRSTDALAPGQLIPASIMGVPCDVFQAKYQPHAADPRTLCDPLLAGVSLGNPVRGTSGTLGAFVRDLDTGAPCVLSCWHVLFGAPSALAGEPVVQPAPPNASSRRIGELLRATDLAHGLDAAVAKVGVTFRDELPGLDLRFTGIAEPEVDMRVVKVGAASRVTHAIIDAVDGSYGTDYSAFGQGICWMDGIHLVPDPDEPEDEISLRGDSGCVFVERSTGKVVALAFGGEDNLGPTAEFAVAHPIARVLDALRVELITSGG
jgi:endonuclease G